MAQDGYVVFGFGKADQLSPFEVFHLIRGVGGPDDVEIEIHYCGINDIDIQFCRNKLDNTNYPIVPGREMTGLVKFIGENVNNFKIGDRVGVGTLVDSCMDCDMCNSGSEHACLKGYTMAYNEPTKHGHISTHAGYTFGGFSQRITVRHNFVIKVPNYFPLCSAAACITSGTSCYAPLKKFSAHKKLLRIGVIGLNNMGMLGIRIASAMGCAVYGVYAFSLHSNKELLAIELGAQGFITWTKSADMKKAYAGFDIILNTLCGPHQIANFLPFLRADGVLVQLGVLNQSHELEQYTYVMRKCLSISGYMSASIRDTEDAMNFCTEHSIMPIQTVVLADQLDDILTILENPATNIARYTLDVKTSFDQLMREITDAAQSRTKNRVKWLAKKRRMTHITRDALHRNRRLAPVAGTTYRCKESYVRQSQRQPVMIQHIITRRPTPPLLKDEMRIMEVPTTSLSLSKGNNATIGSYTGSSSEDVPTETDDDPQHIEDTEQDQANDLQEKSPRCPLHKGRSGC